MADSIVPAPRPSKYRMVLAIWQAIRRATRRDLGTLFSFRLNHFFLFVALMIWGALVVHQPPRSAYPFLLILFLLILGPLSSDPLGHAPATRLEIWPMHTRQRVLLRAATVLLSPILWLALLLAVFVDWRLAATLAAVAVGSQAAIVAGERLGRSHPQWSGLVLVPPIPGPTGQLTRSHARQMLAMLDTYLALMLSLGGTAYRVLAAAPDPAAFPILALLVALALSTAAQALFGLDSGPAMTRYRILPLRGWRILLAKDAAVLAILALLAAPLDPVAGLTFGLTALAIGHFPSVMRPFAQLRWRFQGGRLLHGVPQALAAFAMGFVESQGRPWILAVAAALWIGSVFGAGNLFDRLGRER